MGKGYNNYMCKKPFHPGSKANIKRAWMAEQKTESEKKKQEELKVQYEKEQDLYNNRALISSESKDKLELNFMYQAPPGAKRERQKEDDEPEYKFEWQRKYNAPREDYAKGNADIKDQPFGIPVRNVRCIKCHKWGHINTDKECPLYSQASSSSMPTTSMDPMELMRQMREDGYGLKENVLGHHLNPKAANQQLIPSDESDPETEFLKSLSTAEKKKLLRKLKKLSKKQAKNSRSKKKKSKKSRKSKGKETSDSDSDDKNSKKKRKRKEPSSSSSDSSSDESIEENVKKYKDVSPSKEERPKKIRSQSSDRGDNLNKKKHQEHEKSVDEHSNKLHKSKKSKHKEHARSNWENKNESLAEKDEGKQKKTKDRFRENEKESSTERDKHKNKHDPCATSKKESNDCEKIITVKSNWKSSYSCSSSENEESNKSSKIEVKSMKRKAGCDFPVEDAAKKSKMEKCDSDRESRNLDSNSKNDNDKPEHPDGFSHICPQAKIDANYLPSTEEYKGKTHDWFRHVNRDKRSPSIKQKYNK